MSLAIANRYAAALAEVLDRRGAADQGREAVERLSDFAAVLSSSADLRNVLNSPLAAGSQKRNLIAQIGERLAFSEAVRNLLFVLMDNRRLDLVDEVTAAFRRRLDDAHGVERIEAASALPLAEDQRQALLERFRGILGKTVEGSFVVDESLLGGVVVRSGTLIFDGSLRGQLQTLDRAMSGRA